MFNNLISNKMKRNETRAAIAATLVTVLYVGCIVLVIIF